MNHVCLCRCTYVRICFLCVFSRVAVIALYVCHDVMWTCSTMQSVFGVL